MKEVISKILKEILEKRKIKLSQEEIEKYIEIPPNTEMGDFALPCFFLAKHFKDEPRQIALEIRADLGDSHKEFSEIQTSGPYINFFVNRNKLASELIKDILTKKEKYGKGDLGKIRKTMIEFPSPNTNKPLHLGHLRNLAIGESVSRILESQKEKVIRANLYNDRGIHICKSMLAYQKYGKGKKPTKSIKGDLFVGNFYVMFNKKAKKDKKLEKQAQELLVKWEQGDKETRKLWKEMRDWVINGIEETSRKFGVKHDKNYYESEFYEGSRKIIDEGLKKGVFKIEKDKAIYINLGKKLGKKYLLRNDGTSIYITQDLHLAKLKFDEFKINKSIYVVANEQEYHFNVLFEIIDKLKLLQKDDLYHLHYGMVNLPNGRMKSREGTVVDADDLIETTQSLIKEGLKKREKLSAKELNKRSLIIALSAIKYLLLKVDIKKDTIFNSKESISFEGDTGPYLLYSYARANSILRKARHKTKKTVYVDNLEAKEAELVKKLSQFKEITEKAYLNLNPSLIANYSYQLAQIFNEFYHECPVIGSDNETFRLALIESFKQVLANGLHLLGIETLEKM